MTCWPSGDQVGSVLFAFVSAICLIAVPLISMMYIPQTPEASDENTIEFPSGDHAGSFVVRFFVG